MAGKRIKISQEIIDNSVQANSSHCMIADAVRECLPDARKIQVDLQTIRYSIGDERFIYFTPRMAQLALVRFDQGEEGIVPFEFPLGRPSQVVTRKSKRDPALVDPAKRAIGALGGKKTQERAKLKRSILENSGVTKVGGAVPPQFSVASNLGNRRVYGLRVARA